MYFYMLHGCLEQWQSIGQGYALLTLKALFDHMLREMVSSWFLFYPWVYCVIVGGFAFHWILLSWTFFCSQDFWDFLLCIATVWGYNSTRWLCWFMLHADILMVIPNWPKPPVGGNITYRLKTSCVPLMDCKKRILWWVHKSCFFFFFFVFSRLWREECLLEEEGR